MSVVLFIDLKNRIKGYFYLVFIVGGVFIVVLVIKCSFLIYYIYKYIFIEKEIRSRDLDWILF